MPKQMVTPTISELSGVDHPAHLVEGWLVQKGLNPSDRTLLFEAECIAKGIDPASLTSEDLDPTKGSVTMPLTDAEKAALSPEALSYIKSLEDASAAAITKAVDNADDLDAAAFEKAMAGLPEPARKAFLKQQRETAEAKAYAKSVHDEREDEKFLAIVKSLEYVPGVTDDSAADFRKAHDSNPTAFEAMLKSLTSANAALKESGFFKEIGSAAGGAANGEDSILAIAKAKVAADPKLSLPEAVSQAAAENPELYAAHRKEA